ncbi:MAG: Coenzyme F420 hydrogenase/dehydrogenase, beta subunit C-terminal domain [Prolixibacteraceae bacterium]
MKTESLLDNKQDCCGCRACEQKCPSKAIRMEPDAEGFIYPVIDEQSCVDCGICINVCPLKENYRITNRLFEPVVYAVKHKDLETKRKSTSGGAFTALYSGFIAKGGVVYGVAIDKNTPLKIIHRRADSIQACEMFRGSKYVQSDTGDTFTQVRNDLKKGGSVMYVGTPCQIAGLSSFLGINGPKKYDNLLLVDILCYAVPSPLIWKEHIEYIEKKYKLRVIDYKFRSKRYGWRSHTEEVIFNNGRSLFKSMLSQSFAIFFASRLVNRVSCSRCKFTGTVRPSDITLGDFWGIEKEIPEFKDNLGVSLMMLNTVAGAGYFEEIKNCLHYKKSSVTQAFRKNHSKPSKTNPDRESFWIDYHRNGYEYVLNKYVGLNAHGKVKWYLKKYIKRLVNPEIRLRISYLRSKMRMIAG